jgi:hypothetical protein
VAILVPRIEITVTSSADIVPEGTAAFFTVKLENTGDVSLKDVQTTSAAVPACNKTYSTLAAGQIVTYQCTVSQINERIINEVAVTATTVEGSVEVSDDDTAIVRVQQGVGIFISPAPTVGDTLVRGQDAVFGVTIQNPTTANLTNVVVKAYIDYDVATAGFASPTALIPAPECDKSVGTISPGKESGYSCTIANVQASFEIRVVVTGLIDGLTPVEDLDVQDITVIDLTLEVDANPLEINAGQPTVVQFNLTLTNNSNAQVTLKSLQSDQHGNLLSVDNSAISDNSCPAMNNKIPGNATRTCAYQVTLNLQPQLYQNNVTATVTNANNTQLTLVGEGIVVVGDTSPLEVILAADPINLAAPGGPVNITIQVKNNSSTSLTLDSLIDASAGSIDGQGNCDVPQTLLAGETYSCIYPVVITGRLPGDIVTYTINATAGAEQAGNTVSIPITAGTAAQIMLPSVSNLAVAGEPNNSACAAMPIMSNLTYYFMADDLRDYYKITLTSAADVHFELGNFRADGQILVSGGECGKPQFIQNNGTGDPVQVIELQGLAAGTYIVQVYAVSGYSSTNPYTLRVNITQR